MIENNIFDQKNEAVSTDYNLIYHSGMSSTKEHHSVQETACQCHAKSLKCFRELHQCTHFMPERHKISHSRILHPNRRLKETAHNRFSGDTGSSRHDGLVLQIAHRVAARVQRTEYHPTRAHTSRRRSAGVQTRVKRALHRVRDIDILLRRGDNFHSA